MVKPMVAGHSKINRCFYGRHVSTRTKFYEAMLLITDKSEYLLISRYGKIEKEAVGGALFIESGFSACVKYLDLLKSKRRNGYNVNERTFAPGSFLGGLSVADDVSCDFILKHCRFARNVQDVKDILLGRGVTTEVVNDEGVPTSEPPIVKPKPIIHPAGWGVW